jgi:hypothetical protein
MKPSVKTTMTVCSKSSMLRKEELLESSSSILPSSFLFSALGVEILFRLLLPVVLRRRLVVVVVVIDANSEPSPQVVEKTFFRPDSVARVDAFAVLELWVVRSTVGTFTLQMGLTFEPATRMDCLCRLFRILLELAITIAIVSNNNRRGGGAATASSSSSLLPKPYFSILKTKLLPELKPKPRIKKTIQTKPPLESKAETLPSPELQSPTLQTLKDFQALQIAPIS